MVRLTAGRTPSTIAHLKRVSVGRWLHGTPKNKLVRVFLPLRAFTNTRNLSPTRALLKKQAAETLAKPLSSFTFPLGWYWVFGGVGLFPEYFPPKAGYQ